MLVYIVSQKLYLHRLIMISIGAGVTVGMSALVTKSVPDGETWLGVPAKKIDSMISKK